MRLAVAHVPQVDRIAHCAGRFYSQGRSRTDIDRLFSCSVSRSRQRIVHGDGKRRRLGRRAIAHIAPVGLRANSGSGNVGGNHGKAVHIAGGEGCLALSFVPCVAQCRFAIANQVDLQRRFIRRLQAEGFCLRRRAGQAGYLCVYRKDDWINCAAVGVAHHTPEGGILSNGSRCIAGPGRAFDGRFAVALVP